MSIICSIADYIDELKALHRNSAGSLCDGVKFYYRGESHDYGDTSGQPGIVRNCGLEGNNESNLFREWERRIPEEYGNCRSTFEKLVKMQHYGARTRLLDISLDPLQALFFALYIDPKDHGRRDDDAVVLVYEIPQKQICNWHSDRVSIVANVAVYNYDDLELNAIPDEKDAFNTSKPIHQLLHEIRAEKPHFRDEIEKKHLSEVFCVHPLLSNPRIRAQQGAFLLFGVDGDRHHLAKIENSGIRKHVIRIPSGAKSELLQELTLLGRTVDTIYPDCRGVEDYFNSFWNKNLKDYYRG